MADDHDPHNTSEPCDQPEVAQVKEDAETAATRKELKHTAISEQPVQRLGSDADDSSSNDKTPPRSKTPDDAQNDALKEQVGSPKKKRAHDEVEADPNEDMPDVSIDAAASPPPGSRTTRSAPEKKRHRDAGSISGQDSGGKDNIDATSNSAKEAAKPISTEPLTSPKPTTTSQAPPENNGKAVTSEDAFKKSGFSVLAGTTSPFAAAAAPGKSVFGGNASSTSPFGAPLQKSVFGSGAPLSMLGSSTTTGSSAPALPSLASSSSQSPFGAASNGSTSVLGGFAGSPLVAFGAAGGKLSSFATPGQSSLNKETKPSKDFGAPESDGEEDSDEEADDNADEKDDATSNKEKEGSQPPSEDKKKPKLQKVRVDDGEATEATLVSVRAKIYVLDRTANTWKERGTGYLKINVPVGSVELDDKGNPIPGSFDASSLGESDSDIKSGPRMIMRQDHTHRVILNAAIGPSITFNQTDSLKAAHLIFQAPEDNALKTLQLKMSNANVKDFLKEFESINRELAA